MGRSYSFQETYDFLRAELNELINQVTDSIMLTQHTHLIRIYGTLILAWKVHWVAVMLQL
jgi:hypothetical protein